MTKHYKSRSTLEQFIALANLLPRGSLLPEPSALQPEGQHRKMLEELYAGFERKFLLPDVFPRRFSALRVPEPSDLRKVTSYQFGSGAELYPQFFSVCKAIEAIAKLNDAALSGEEVPTWKGPTGMTTERARRVLLPPQPAAVAVFLSRDGIAHVMGDPRGHLYQQFLDHLNGAELTRLKRCPVCSRFFWARRSDQEACAKRCANVRRVRQHRADAGKATERRENRRVKKNRAKGRAYK